MPIFAVCDVKLDPKGGSPGNLQFRKLAANINERCLCKLKSSCFSDWHGVHSCLTVSYILYTLDWIICKSLETDKLEYLKRLIHEYSCEYAFG